MVFSVLSAFLGCVIALRTSMVHASAFCITTLGMQEGDHHNGIEEEAALLT